jgi:hypothetical protein
MFVVAGCQGRLQFDLARCRSSGCHLAEAGLLQWLRAHGVRMELTWWWHAAVAWALCTYTRLAHAVSFLPWVDRCKISGILGPASHKVPDLPRHLQIWLLCLWQVLEDQQRLACVLSWPLFFWPKVCSRGEYRLWHGRSGKWGFSP